MAIYTSSIIQAEDEQAHWRIFKSVDVQARWCQRLFDFKWPAGYSVTKHSSVNVAFHQWINWSNLRTSMGQDTLQAYGWFYYTFSFIVLDKILLRLR